MMTFFGLIFIGIGYWAMVDGWGVVPKNTTPILISYIVALLPYLIVDMSKWVKK